MPIKEYANEPCKECKNKEKPTPKSFKFDIRVTEFSQECRGPYSHKTDTNSISGYSVSTGKTIRFENFPAPEWIDFNKEYTIEIKEKE